MGYIVVMGIIWFYDQRLWKHLSKRGFVTALGLSDGRMGPAHGHSPLNCIPLKKK